MWGILQRMRCLPIPSAFDLPTATVPLASVVAVRIAIVGWSS